MAIFPCWWQQHFINMFLNVQTLWKNSSLRWCCGLGRGEEGTILRRNTWGRMSRPQQHLSLLWIATFRPFMRPQWGAEPGWAGMTSGWERAGRTEIVCEEKWGQEVVDGKETGMQERMQWVNTPASTRVPRDRADPYHDSLLHSTS